MTYTTSISSKGQITVPAQLRRELCIQTGDQLRVEVKAGSLVIVPDTYESELQDLRAIAKQHLEKQGLVNMPIKEIKQRAADARTIVLQKKHGLRT